MTKHTRTIESNTDSGETEYSVACSCRSFYESRIRTWTEAVAIDKAHKAAVADGTWQAEQDAKAAALAAAAPRNEAIRRHAEAVDARRSAGFGVLIAKQREWSEPRIAAARTELAEADAELAAAAEALAAFDR